MIRSSGLILMMAAVGLGACTGLKRTFDRSFGERFGASSAFWRTLDEFDSACKRHNPALEPDRLEYADEPERLPWWVRQFEGSGIDFLLQQSMSLTTSKVKQSNPSGFARDRMSALIRMVGSNAERGAQVASRLLWVVEADETNTLNRVTALAGLEQIMRSLKIDPTAPELLAADDSRDREIEIDRAELVMRKYWPDLRENPQLTPEDRRAFTAAVKTETASALPFGKEQRLLVLTFASAFPAERDREMRVVLRQAMIRALGLATALGLRDALRADSSDVRDGAIRVYRRLAGPKGLAFVLRQIAAPPGGAGNPYDQSPAVRLTLVRLCSQLKLATATITVQGGKMPVDFLYDTAVADSEPGLRSVALEGLALCIGRRKITFDDDEWAKEWRQKFIVDRQKR